jgi:hypothetical protein
MRGQTDIVSFLGSKDDGGLFTLERKELCVLDLSRSIGSTTTGKENYLVAGWSSVIEIQACVRLSDRD